MRGSAWAGRWRWGVVVWGAVAWASPASAQIPEEFTNLQHFAEDIPRQALINQMRRMSLELGVRCQHCHVGSVDGVSFEGVDFASDDSPSKRTARFMLGLVDRLNAEIGDAVDGGDPTEVTCKTCHRGGPQPRLLWQELSHTLDVEGATGLEDAYARAAEQVRSGRYDLGEWELNLWAERLLGEGRTTDALAVLELNLEHHPESLSILSTLGGLYEAAERTEDALAMWRRVVELQPENGRAIERVRALGGGG